MAITWTSLPSTGGGGVYWYARVVNDGDFPKKFCKTTRLLPADVDVVTDLHAFGPDGVSYDNVAGNLGTAGSLLTRQSYGEPESVWPQTPGQAPGTLFWDTTGFLDPRISVNDDGVVIIKPTNVACETGIIPLPSTMQTDLESFYYPKPTHIVLGVGGTDYLMSVLATGRSDICHLRCCDPYGEVRRPVDLTGPTPAYSVHSQIMDTPTGVVSAAYAGKSSIFLPLTLPNLEYWQFYDKNNGDMYVCASGRAITQIGNIEDRTKFAGAHSLFGFPPQIQIGAYGREQTSAGNINQTISAVVKTYRGSTLVDSATIFTGQPMTDAGASLSFGYRVTRYGPTYHSFPASLSAEGTTAWTIELSGVGGPNDGQMDGAVFFKQPCQTFPHAMSDWPLPAGDYIPGRCFKMP